jgi:hypothetical protein
MAVPGHTIRDRRRRRTLGVLGAVLLSGLAALLWWGSGSVAQPRMAAGRDIALTGILSEQQFLAGDQVRISAEVADDIFATGRTVIVDGAKAVTLVTGAGRLEIRNTTLRDLIAGGLEAEISGTIEDDMVVGICPACPMGSGQLVIAPSTRVGSDARLAAASIEMKGAIGGNLRAAAHRIVISGDVAGNVELRGHEIILEPTARITGTLTTWSPSPPSIAAGAQVGQSRHVATHAPFPDRGEMRQGMIRVAAVAAAITVAGLFLFAILAQLAVPAVIGAAALRVHTQLWASVGVGLAVLLLAPVLLALLAVTLIGAPAALVGGAALFVLFALAVVLAAFVLGLWLRARLTRAETWLASGMGARIGWTLLGMLLLILLQAVPVVGWIIGFIAFLAALGAIAGALRERSGVQAAPA